MAAKRDVRFPEDDDAVDGANLHDVEGDLFKLSRPEGNIGVVARSRVSEETREDEVLLSSHQGSCRKDHAAVRRGKQTRRDGFVRVDGRGTIRLERTLNSVKEEGLISAAIASCLCWSWPSSWFCFLCFVFVVSFFFFFFCGGKRTKVESVLVGGDFERGCSLDGNALGNLRREECRGWRCVSAFTQNKTKQKRKQKKARKKTNRDGNVRGIRGAVVEDYLAVWLSNTTASNE